jgi:hypothetical protein
MTPTVLQEEHRVTSITSPKNQRKGQFATYNLCNGNQITVRVHYAEKQKISCFCSASQSCIQVRCAITQHRVQQDKFDMGMDQPRALRGAHQVQHVFFFRKQENNDKARFSIVMQRKSMNIVQTLGYAMHPPPPNLHLLAPKAEACRMPNSPCNFGLL